MIQEVWHGDCLELMDNIKTASIDFILTDLPYGSTKCKWDVIIPFDSLWKQYNRIIKNNGVVALFGSEPFSSYLRISNIENYKYDWTWDKVTARGHLVAKKRPMQQTECISIFYKSAPTYNPQMVDRPKDKIEIRKTTEYNRTEIMGGEKTNAPINVVYDKWYPKTIIKISNAGSSVKSIHPTQKPVELLEYLIKTYTNDRMLILDSCVGSGSTLVAAKNLNRQFIGIEKDENYFKSALDRLNRC